MNKYQKYSVVVLSLFAIISYGSHRVYARMSNAQRFFSAEVSESGLGSGFSSFMNRIMGGGSGSGSSGAADSSGGGGGSGSGSGSSGAADSSLGGDGSDGSDGRSAGAEFGARSSERSQSSDEKYSDEPPACKSFGVDPWGKDSICEYKVGGETGYTDCSTKPKRNRCRKYNGTCQAACEKNADAVKAKCRYKAYDSSCIYTVPEGRGSGWCEGHPESAYDEDGLLQCTRTKFDICVFDENGAPQCQAALTSRSNYIECRDEYINSGNCFIWKSECKGPKQRSYRCLEPKK